MKILRTFVAVALATAPFTALAAADDAGDQGQDQRSDRADERSNSQVAPDATRGQDRANEVRPSPMPTRSPSVEPRDPNSPARDSGTRRTPDPRTRDGATDDSMPRGGADGSGDTDAGSGSGSSGAGTGGSTGGSSGGGSR